MAKDKKRLDVLLVERNFCSSRQQAQRCIRAGEVMVAREVVDKPGTEVPIAAEIHVKPRSLYVSRGGEKLAAALEAFPITVANRVCLDGGISTGGFTDCLLQNGARRVYGVDVGYGQVDWKLRNDPRLVLRERTNLRHLTAEQLYAPGAEFPDLGVADLSFISLVKVLPRLWELLQPPRDVILLVKPQFEVGRDRVGKKGVVRHSGDRAAAIAQVIEAARALGWNSQGVVPSPITGPAGNFEYLLWLNLRSPANPLDFQQLQEIAALGATTTSSHSQN